MTVFSHNRKGLPSIEGPGSSAVTRPEAGVGTGCPGGDTLSGDVTSSMLRPLPTLSPLELARHCKERKEIKVILDLLYLNSSLYMGKIRLSPWKAGGPAWVSTGCVVQVLTIQTDCKDICHPLRFCSLHTRVILEQEL